MKSFVFLFTAIIALFSLPAMGTVINVPGDYAAIQDAINASVNNDTVLVADGTYIENIDFGGKAILLTSQNGPDRTTIHIQTSGVPVVTMDSGEGPGSILSGFTIEGNLSWWGVYINNASPTIYNNIIREHEVGIRIDYGTSPLIRKNEITLCSHSDHIPHNGGAIRMILGNNAVIDSNKIHGNYSDVAGAIYLNNCSDVTVERNLIYSNSSIYIGGLEISACGNINVYNNTFVDNTSLGPQYILGAINVSHSSNITVKNNISAFNNEYGICNYQNNTNLVTAYNDVYGNNPANYYNWSPGTGSISSDPLFVDTTNHNFYLDEYSPCINAGDPAGPFDPDGTTLDFGALYYPLGPAVYGCLAGTVADTFGAPIQNVHISEFNLGYETLTDINGEFFIDSAIVWSYHHIIFSHPDYIDTTVHHIIVSPGDTISVDVEMLPLPGPGAVSGIVTDSNQVPLPNVLVEIEGTDITGYSNVSGEYFISDIYPGSYNISFKKMWYIDHIEPAVLVMEGDTITLNVQMAQGSDQDILVAYGNLDGSPITAAVGTRISIDVYIMTAPDIYLSWIDMALGFEDLYFDSLLSRTEGLIFDVLPSWEYVEFRPPIGSPPNPEGWSAENLLAFNYSSGSPNPYLNCPVPTKILTFIVKASDDPSLIGDTVQCLGPGLNEFGDPTIFGDSSGGLPPEFAEFFCPVHFVEPALYTGTLSGTVTNESLQPIENAVVILEGSGLSDITNSGGQFLIENVTQSVYNLSISHSHYCDTVLAGVTVVVDETTTVEVILGGAGYIAGTVTNIGDTAIGGAVVSVPETGHEDTTDADGRYLLMGLCPGMYDVLFDHPDYVPNSVMDVTVTVGDTTPANALLYRPAIDEAVLWYGNPNCEPILAHIGDTVYVDLYAQTADSMHVNLIHAPLRSRDQYIVSRNGGQLYYPLTEWYDVSFSSISGSPPNPTGWTNQSVYGIANIFGYSNPVLQAPNPIKIATYRMVSVNDTSLAGQIIDCMASGADPSHGVSAVSDTAGYRLSLTEIFCPLYFSSPFLGSIEGIVSDINANPIAGVAVECMGTGIVDTTNGLGEYVLPEIDPGTYNVSFTHPDYLPVIMYNVDVIAGQVTVVDVTLAEITGNCVYVTGDVNNSGAYNGLDVTFGVNFFKGGPEPLYSCECTPGNIWYVAGDVNNSCNYNGLDITYGVAYFKGGPDPMPCEDCPPAVSFRVNNKDTKSK